MKKALVYVVVLVSALTVLSQCGPSKQEREAQEKARKDSLAKVRADSIAKVEDQQRQAEAERQRQLALEAEREKRRIEYDANGNFTVQVESWRSQELAQRKVDVWKKRGYTNAYVVEHGDPESGDVWYRVRLGNMKTRAMAQKLAALILEEYKINAWAALIGDEKPKTQATE